MAQPLHPAHPVSDDPATTERAPSAPVVAGAALGSLAVLATLALWFHYGTQVFFETIRAGLSACF
jgi:hypothetical protein